MFVFSLLIAPCVLLLCSDWFWIGSGEPSSSGNPPRLSAVQRPSEWSRQIDSVQDQLHILQQHQPVSGENDSSWWEWSEQQQVRHLLPVNTACLCRRSRAVALWTATWWPAASGTSPSVTWRSRWRSRSLTCLNRYRSTCVCVCVCVCVYGS